MAQEQEVELGHPLPQTHTLANNRSVPGFISFLNALGVAMR